MSDDVLIDSGTLLGLNLGKMSRSKLQDEVKLQVTEIFYAGCQIFVEEIMESPFSKHINTGMMVSSLRPFAKAVGSEYANFPVNPKVRSRAGWTGIDGHYHKASRKDALLGEEIGAGMYTVDIHQGVLKFRFNVKIYQWAKGDNSGLNDAPWRSLHKAYIAMMTHIDVEIKRAVPRLVKSALTHQVVNRVVKVANNV